MSASGANEAKIIFVSNNHGTTLFEIFSICNILPLTVLVNLAATVNFLPRSLRKNSFLRSFLLEQVFCTAPVLMLSTVLSTWLVYLVPALTLVCAISLKRYAYLLLTILSNKQVAYVSSAPEYVSNYKAAMHLATAISILAVDFHVFPRRFAKAEVYGVGGMDCAVGIFIFSMGLTSVWARGGCKNTNARDVLRKCLPLLLLGGVRVIAVKLSGYHEHVSEYGVHWNFFLTLALVQISAHVVIASIRCCIRRASNGSVCLVASVALITLHQLMLSRFGMAEFVQLGSMGDGSRHNLIDANREGLISSVGYLSVYLFGAYVGGWVVAGQSSRLTVLNTLLVGSGLAWLATYLATLLVTPISRQMANFSYWLLQIAINTQLLATFIILDMIADVTRARFDTSTSATEEDGGRDFPSQTSHVRRRTIELTSSNLDETITSSSFDNIRCPMLYKAISRYQLVYFLLANVITGIVNMSVNTLGCGDLEAIVILCVYVLCVNFIVVMFHRFRR